MAIKERSSNNNPLIVAHNEPVQLPISDINYVALFSVTSRDNVVVLMPIFVNEQTLQCAACQQVTTTSYTLYYNGIGNVHSS